jgi:hypothetical protein
VFAKTVAGTRHPQRQFRDWTGQSPLELQWFVGAESARTRMFARPQSEPPNLAAVVAEAGFADRSHLGGDVQKVTALALSCLRGLMRTDEAFRFDRLLRKHARDGTSPKTDRPTKPARGQVRQVCARLQL